MNHLSSVCSFFFLRHSRLLPPCAPLPVVSPPHCTRDPCLCSSSSHRDHLSAVPKAEPIDAADAAEQTPVVKPSGRAGKKVKREGGASRASPKPTARKQAPAAAHAAAAATAAARSGSFFDILTDEERGLMEQEGITVPKKGPLSKASERELKRLRRQVKNKYSAKDSRKKRKEYMDGLAQANADLADQLTASRRDASALRSKLRGVQSLFRPAAKASVGVASKTRKSAVLLLCLLFSRQHGLDLGSMTGLSDLNLTTSADSPPLDSWSTDEGTASPMEEEEEEDDSSLPKWMSKCVDRIPGVSTLSDARAFGVFETARKAAMEYLRKDDPLALVVAPSAPFKSEEVTGWPLTPERHTAVQ